MATHRPRAQLRLSEARSSSSEASSWQAICVCVYCSHMCVMCSHEDVLHSHVDVLCSQFAVQCSYQSQCCVLELSCCTVCMVQALLLWAKLESSTVHASWHLQGATWKCHLPPGSSHLHLVLCCIAHMCPWHQCCPECSVCVLSGTMCVMVLCTLPAPC
jgi:hypothetical protein